MIEIAAIGAQRPFVLEALEREFVVHRVWDAPDKAAALRPVAERVRGAVSNGMGGCRRRSSRRCLTLRSAPSTASGWRPPTSRSPKPAAWWWRPRPCSTTTSPISRCSSAWPPAGGSPRPTATYAPAAGCRAGWRRAASSRASAPASSASGGSARRSRGGLRASGCGSATTTHSPSRACPTPRGRTRWRSRARATSCSCAPPAATAAGGSSPARSWRRWGPPGCSSTSRGWLVDEAALVDCLRTGGLGAAGLDVFEDEPHVPGVLLELDNVVLAPHIASNTEETVRAMGECVLANIRSWFAGKGALTPVA